MLLRVAFVNMYIYMCPSTASISYDCVFFSRLKQHLNPGGRLYIVGMNPIADHSNACNGAAEIITEVRRARDACILLAGHRPYR